MGQWRRRVGWGMEGVRERVSGRRKGRKECELREDLLTLQTICLVCLIITVIKCTN